MWLAPASTTTYESPLCATRVVVGSGPRNLQTNKRKRRTHATQKVYNHVLTAVLRAARTNKHHARTHPHKDATRARTHEPIGTDDGYIDPARTQVGGDDLATVEATHGAIGRQIRVHLVEHLHARRAAPTNQPTNKAEPPTTLPWTPSSECVRRGERREKLFANQPCAACHVVTNVAGCEASERANERTAPWLNKAWVVPATCVMVGWYGVQLYSNLCVSK